MNAKQRRVFARVFAHPTPANIRWDDIKSLLISLGAEISQRSGSAVAVELKGETAVFHEPHPESNAPRGLVRAVREFLENAGVSP
jgi:hypothetical protein